MNRTIPIKRAPKMPPVHPGEILREDVLPALGATVSQAAKRLGVSRQSLYRLLAGNSAVTPEMALRLGKYCRNGPAMWLRLQQAYDLWHAEHRFRREIARIQAG